MLPGPNLTIPPREQFRTGEPTAGAHLIRVGQCLGNQISMFRQQVRMPLGYMPFPLWRQLDLAFQVRALKQTHRASSFKFQRTPTHEFSTLAFHGIFSGGLLPELLGEPDENSFWTPDVAEPVDVLEGNLSYFTYR
jgi:hypothetical protein